MVLKAASSSAVWSMLSWKTLSSFLKTAIFVDVGGAVYNSGLYALPPGSRVADAIAAAGGTTDNADITYINRATVLNDGDKLYIPTAAEVKSGTAPPSAGQVTKAGGYSGPESPAAGSSSGAATGGDGSAGKALVNINTANSDELQTLNGVGPVTAQKIID